MVEKKALFNQTKLKSDFIKLIADNSATAVYAADFETDELIYLNPMGASILGVNSDNISGKKCYEFLMRLREHCPFCHKSNLCCGKFEDHNLTFPQNNRHYRIRSTLVNWNNRMIHVHYISDETELLDEQKELRSLTEKIPTGVGVYNFYNDGRLEVVYLNDSYYHMLGSKREDRLQYQGFKQMDAMHPDDKNTILEGLKAAVKNNTQFYSEVRIIDNKGNYKWFGARADIAERTEDKTVFYCSFSDVDELKNSEARFRGVMQHIPGALVVFEVKNKMLYLKFISEGISAITGYSADEIWQRDGNIPLAESHPGGKEFFLSHEWDNVQKNKNISYKYRAKCKNGNFKWVSLEISPILEHGEKLYYGIIRDVDLDEVKAIEKRNYYEEQIDYLNHLESPDMIAKGSYNLSKNKLLSYNKYNQTGINTYNNISYDEVVNVFISTAATETEGNILYSKLNREHLLKEFWAGKSSGSIEYKRKDLNGSSYWSSLNYTMCTDTETNDVIFIVYSLDVTTRVMERRMIEMLGKTEYDLMGYLDVETKKFHTQGFIKDGNKSIPVNTLMGGNFDEAMGEYINKAVNLEDRDTLLKNLKVKNILRELDINSMYVIYYSITKQENEHKRKKLSLCYLDDTKTTIFYFRSDVTEIYEKEERQLLETQRALKEAKVANQAKTDFLSQMSHDMRTPMNGIIGLAQLSVDENNPAILKEYFTKIKESGEYLLSLINDTLDFQRIESGKLKIEPKPTNAKSLIDSIVQLMKPSFDNKEIKFIIEQLNNKSFDKKLWIDPVRFKQILVNLLSNSLKFTPNGGIIKVSYECISIKDGIWNTKFVVQDTGIGMSKDFLKNGIFQAFSQESSKVSMNYTGSGLGLSIVKSLVQMMGGTISVDSELGTGTEFTILLGFKEVDIGDISSKEESIEKEKNKILEILKGKKILLAEDNALNAEIAKKLLERVKCRITWVKDGNECIAEFLKKKPETYDIILMDICMPNLGGLAATEKIRLLERPDAREIPIVAMTANAYDTDVANCLKAGMNDHIAKPIDKDKMYYTIAKNMEKYL